jgi:hypothetical protein
LDQSKLHELVSRLKDLSHQLNKTPLREEFITSGISKHWIEKAGGYRKLLELADLKPEYEKTYAKPKILILDIETLPMVVYTWDLWPESISPKQIIKDWSVASWSAKWLGEDEIIYEDVRDKPLKDMRDDKAMLKKIWSLIDQADILVTQNGKSFDVKKLGARFFKHKFKPTTSFRHYDTKQIAKRFFKFSSNRLAYMTEEFNEVYKKLDHSSFPGFDLWLQCMAGNMKAWDEMEKYNKYDVLALEELFLMMLPYDKTINWNVFTDNEENICSCGGTDFSLHSKFKTTNAGRYERLVCKKCGKEHFKKENLLSKSKRKNLLK